MKITQEVREYARKNKLNEVDAVTEGMEEKAKEFSKEGEIYIKQ